MYKTKALTKRLLPFSHMKKTLFLTALLGLSSMSTYAEYTADVFLPQSIITVQQGEKADRNTASTEGLTGWASGTTSQICIAGGALTLDANAEVTIEFGGKQMINDGMFGQEQAFTVVLVKGGRDELVGQLTSLLAHTTFTLTSDAEVLTP